MTETLNQPPKDPSNSHWGMLVLLIGFIGLVIWAAFAPLDEGVPCPAVVNFDTKRKVIQHLTGGIIQTIYVKENQHVNVDETLIKLDDAMNKARYEEIRQRYIGLRSEESRLLAEQAGDRKIRFHQYLMNHKKDPITAQQMKNQEMLLNARRKQLEADLHGFKDAIHGQEASIRGIMGQIESGKTQLNITNQQLDGIKKLVEKGFAPRNQQLDLEAKVAQLEGVILDGDSNITRAKRTIDELNHRSISREEEFNNDVNTRIASVKLEVDMHVDKLKALQDELSRSEIKSPVEGQVVGLQFQTVGAIIQPGQNIMDVVPENDGLMLEAKIQPQMIDRMQIGQMADIQFFNFAKSPQLIIEGKIDSLSKDLIMDPNTNTPQSGHYLARISLTDKGIKTLGGRTLQSGMPAQVIIKTGERSLLTYLLHPFMKRLAASLKEE
ncbi:AcrA Membrane-fusion protein [Methylophilaceae bacterium]